MGISQEPCDKCGKVCYVDDLPEGNVFMCNKCRNELMLEFFKRVNRN